MISKDYLKYKLNHYERELDHAISKMEKARKPTSFELWRVITIRCEERTKVYRELLSDLVEVE